jgi:hypothetical protein
MVSVQNKRASDRDVLANASNWNLVGIVLACGYRVCLARRVYADYLDHQITVLGVPLVTTICEVAVSLIQVQSQVNVAVSFVYDSVYCPGSSNT